MYILKSILLLGIFCTSTTIGLLISRRYSARVKILKDLKNALNIFEVKMNFSFETIPEIFNEISEKIHGTVGSIFSETVKNINAGNMMAGEAWEKSIESNKENLKKEDVECIKTLGKMLGKTENGFFFCLPLSERRILRR